VFRDSSALTDWFEAFRDRYPGTPGSPFDLDPTPGFRLRVREDFAVELPMTLDSYVAYLMTETNVAAAIERGIAADEIRSWSAETLLAIFDENPRGIVFTGYFACLERG
jgi:hypothetical protein